MTPIWDWVCPDEFVSLFDKDTRTHPSSFYHCCCPVQTSWGESTSLMFVVEPHKAVIQWKPFYFHSPQFISDTLLLLLHNLPFYYLPSYYNISTFSDWQHLILRKFYTNQSKPSVKYCKYSSLWRPQPACTNNPLHVQTIQSCQLAKCACLWTV